MERINPFIKIYQQCNGSTNIEKYNALSSVSSAVPIYLDVELTNCCNIQCNMCPVGVGTMKRAKGIMSDEVFHAILSNIRKYHIQAVRLIRWGEPTLHPHFIDWIRRLKQEHVLVHFNTNGLLLDEELIEKIISSGLDSIKFSFQGINDQTYSEMRSGGSYAQLLTNIKTMYRMRGDRQTPYISVSTSTTYESPEEIAHFKAEVGPYCDEVNAGKTKMLHVDLEHMNLSAERRKVYEQFMSEDHGYTSHMAVCPEIWDKLSINWDGSVSACCQDYDNMMLVGNILENDLPEIFMGAKEKHYREILKNGDYDKLALCQNCYEYIPLKH